MLNATPGAADANSYLTVDEADAIANERGLGRAASAWLSADDATKEKALIRASSEIDAYMVTTATRWASDQALLFPRYADADAMNVPYIIPNVRMATFEQAAHVNANADKIDDADTRRARGLISFSDDDASGSVARSGFGLLSSRAEAYMKGILAAGRTTLKSVDIDSSYGNNYTRMLDPWNL
jgi:hypothetical protein